MGSGCRFPFHDLLHCLLIAFKDSGQSWHRIWIARLLTNRWIDVMVVWVQVLPVIYEFSVNQLKLKVLVAVAYLIQLWAEVNSCDLYLLCCCLFELPVYPELVLGLITNWWCHSCCGLVIQYAIRQINSLAYRPPPLLSEKQPLVHISGNPHQFHHSPRAAL